MQRALDWDGIMVLGNRTHEAHVALHQSAASCLVSVSPGACSLVPGPFLCSRFGRTGTVKQPRKSDYVSDYVAPCRIGSCAGGPGGRDHAVSRTICIDSEWRISGVPARTGTEKRRVTGTRRAMTASCYGDVLLSAKSSGWVLRRRRAQRACLRPREQCRTRSRKASRNS